MEINAGDSCARVTPKLKIDGLDPAGCSNSTILRKGLCQYLCFCPVLPLESNGANLVNRTGRLEAR